MAQYSRKELEGMTIPAIKAIMKEEEVTPLTGKKADLIDRLLNALNPDEADEVDDESPDDEPEPESKGAPSREELNKMTMTDIKDIMRSKGVRPLTGKKSDLIDRLLEALQGEHFVATKLPASSFGEHLTRAQKRQVMKKPAGTDYKLRKMKEEINDLANAGNADDLNLAIEKVQGYTGFDKTRLIAFVMQKNFEMGNSVEDCLAILNEIIDYEDKLSYDQLYDYLMPFFMGVFTTYDGEKDDDHPLMDSLNQMIQDGLNSDTILIAMARTGRRELIAEFLEVNSIPSGVIWETLAKEVFYLMSIANLDRLDREL